MLFHRYAWALLITKRITDICAFFICFHKEYLYFSLKILKKKERIQLYQK